MSWKRSIRRGYLERVLDYETPISAVQIRVSDVVEMGVGPEELVRHVVDGERVRPRQPVLVSHDAAARPMPITNQSRPFQVNTKHYTPNEGNTSGKRIQWRFKKGKKTYEPTGMTKKQLLCGSVRFSNE